MIVTLILALAFAIVAVIFALQNPTLLSVIVASLMAGSLVWGLQQPSGFPGGESSAGPIWSRRARWAFLSEVSAVCLLSIGFVALLLFRVTLSDLPPGSERTPGYLITAVNMVASVTALHWAARRWADRSRLAFFVPIPVVLIGIITVVAIQLVF